MSKKTVPVTVNFTPKEKIQIRKQAGKNLLGMSPFLRKTVIESLGIKVEDEA